MAWSTDPITKPHTLTNLADLLSQGLLGSMSRFSHFQIVEWCARFPEEFDGLPSDDLPTSPEQAIVVADDVIVQWELFIAAQYTLEELGRFSLSDVVLPKPFFESWLNQLLQLPTQH
ncbi:MAG: hypothetical protein ACX931_01575 [Saccharospirillum sp.]|jgi:hypothetical protein